jgi:hypothetical protein
VTGRLLRVDAGLMEARRGASGCCVFHTFGLSFDGLRDAKLMETRRERPHGSPSVGCVFNAFGLSFDGLRDSPRGVRMAHFNAFGLSFDGLRGFFPSVPAKFSPKCYSQGRIHYPALSYSPEPDSAFSDRFVDS